MDAAEGVGLRSASTSPGRSVPLVAAVEPVQAQTLHRRDHRVSPRLSDLVAPPPPSPYPPEVALHRIHVDIVVTAVGVPINLDGFSARAPSLAVCLPILAACHVYGTRLARHGRWRPSRSRCGVRVRFIVHQSYGRRWRCSRLGALLWGWASMDRRGRAPAATGASAATVGLHVLCGAGY